MANREGRQKDAKMNMLEDLFVPHIVIYVVFAGVLIVVLILVQCFRDQATTGLCLTQQIARNDPKDECLKPNLKVKKTKTQKRNAARRAAKLRARQSIEKALKEGSDDAEDSLEEILSVVKDLQSRGKTTTDTLIENDSSEQVEMLRAEAETDSKTKTQRRRARRRIAGSRRTGLEKAGQHLDLTLHRETLNEQEEAKTTTTKEQSTNSDEEEKEEGSTRGMAYQLEQSGWETVQRRTRTKEKSVETKSQLRRERKKKTELQQTSVEFSSVNDASAQSSKPELESEHSEKVCLLSPTEHVPTHLKPKTPSTLAISGVEDCVADVDTPLAPRNHEPTLITVDSHLDSGHLAIKDESRNKASIQPDAGNQIVEETERSRKTAPSSTDPNSTEQTTTTSSPSSAQLFSWADDVEEAEEGVSRESQQACATSAESPSQSCLILPPDGIAALQGQTRRDQSFLCPPEHIEGDVD